VYTSPLARCVSTGAAIAGACAIPSSAVDQLDDIDYGDWQMKTHDEMRTHEPDLYALWFSNPQLVRFPRGETLQELASRSADALRFVLELHPDQTVVMVAHDSVNRALLVQLAGLPLSAYWIFAQAPCCINEIDIAPPRIQILGVNDTSHLDGLESGDG
jgi:probable phosphoglycerate mutase